MRCTVRGSYCLIAAAVVFIGLVALTANDAAASVIYTGNSVTLSFGRLAVGTASKSFDIDGDGVNDAIITFDGSEVGFTLTNAGSTGVSANIISDPTTPILYPSGSTILPAGTFDGSPTDTNFVADFGSSTKEFIGVSFLDGAGNEVLGAFSVKYALTGTGKSQSTTFTVADTEYQTVPLLPLTVPEPASIAVVALTGLGLLSHRRRQTR